MSATAPRLRARTAVLTAKRSTGISWAELAGAIGRSNVWTAAALLGQCPLDEAQRQMLGELLRLDPDTIERLAEPPVRGTNAVDLSEPSVARLQEIVQVYGRAVAELIREEFGDGIMSAIDFEMSVERRPDRKGDRVVVTMNGKFLPYRPW